MEVILQAEVLKGRDPGSKLSQPHHHSKVPANCIVDTGVLDLHHNWCSLRKGALRRHPSAQSSPVHLSTATSSNSMETSHSPVQDGAMDRNKPLKATTTGQIQEPEGPGKGGRLHNGHGGQR
mmetsp:Transcript_17883/g.50063  ORF Transcript_17883/g.50063 Transcript_17883/m.50063 type:complete len:122 (-) Transcript_17883:161-526(-)